MYPRNSMPVMQAPSLQEPKPSVLGAERAGGGVDVRVANRDPTLISQARALVRRRYADVGLGTAQLAAAEAEEGMILVASQDGRVVGTLTLRFDGDSGAHGGRGCLGADEQYRSQLDALRNQGARLCEAVRLAFEPSFGTPRNLALLFEAALDASLLGSRPTDVVIECHPRHARFYRRVLGMAQLGPLSLCRRVLAPAVLMHLPVQRLAAWLGCVGGRACH